ncbi:MAG: hypothetical protein IJ435_04855 [Clostridia bacterium]|nr:hypothetical protein [Clostridia bacterium]
MFGRVVVNKSELKFKEFDVYRAHYCGICRSLKKNGYLSSLCLNYDMTFLAMLLNSLYDSENHSCDARCICHVCKKHRETTDKYSPYVADMTILLAYYKCLDDWQDDKNIIKLFYGLYLKPKFKAIEKKYPGKCDCIKRCLTELLEKERCASLEECANLFGTILGEVFTPENDMWKDTLFRLGFFLGKFIYIADARDDIEEDIKKKRPNPLRGMYSAPDFQKECEIILNMMATEGAMHFEKLPLVDNIEILRNIIYSGIWQHKPHKRND